MLLGLGAPDSASVRGNDVHAVPSFALLLCLTDGKVRRVERG